MKKTILLLMSLCLVCALTGCACDHMWEGPTCDEPKTCSKCKKTEGEPLEHAWIEATFTSPKRCSECGLTEGEPEESPYKDCKTWEEIFSAFFESPFVVERVEDNVYMLTFSDVDNITEFMAETFVAATSIGMPEIVGISIDEEIEGAFFRVEEVGTIAAVKMENRLFGIATMFHGEGETRQAREMQTLYNEGFAFLNIG